MRSEQDLVKGVRKRDRKALSEFYDRYAPVLLGLCMRYCGIRADAEDVLHDAFMKILNNLERFTERPDGSFEGWMKRITVNTALNFLRSRTKAQQWIGTEMLTDTLTEEDEQPLSLADLASTLEKEEILAMICDLPQGYRTVFNLYVFESYSHKDIAEMMNCTENTSKSQLSKARSLLRKKLSLVVNTKNHEIVKNGEVYNNIRFEQKH